MFCNNCGRQISEDERFCGGCGTEIKQGGTVRCKNCGEEVDRGAKFCNKCGAPVFVTEQNEKKFCQYCGHEFREGELFCNQCGKARPSARVADKREVKASGGKNFFGEVSGIDQQDHKIFMIKHIILGGIFLLMLIFSLIPCMAVELGYFMDDINLSGISPYMGLGDAMDEIRSSDAEAMIFIGICRLLLYMLAWIGVSVFISRASMPKLMYKRRRFVLPIIFSAWALTAFLGDYLLLFVIADDAGLDLSITFGGIVYLIFVAANLGYSIYMCIENRKMIGKYKAEVKLNA